MSASSGTSSWAVPPAIPARPSRSCGCRSCSPGQSRLPKNHYHLVFDVNEVRTDITRVRNFSNLGITEKEAAALGNEALLPGSKPGPEPRAGCAMAMIEVDHEMRAHREALCDIGPHVVELGPHRIVLIDSARRRHPLRTAGGMWELLKQWWEMATKTPRPSSAAPRTAKGCPDEAYAVAVAASNRPRPRGRHRGPARSRSISPVVPMPWFLRRRPVRPKPRRQRGGWRGTPEAILTCAARIPGGSAGRAPGARIPLPRAAATCSMKASRVAAQRTSSAPSPGLERHGGPTSSSPVTPPPQ